MLRVFGKTVGTVLHAALIGVVCCCVWVPRSAGQQGPKAALLTPPPPVYQGVPGPVPSHRFWTAKNWFPTNLTDQGGPYTMFPEPLAVQTTRQGLLVGYSSHLNVMKDFYVHPVQPDLTIGVAGLNAGRVMVAAHTDRMVDFDFGPIKTRIGRGMPFVYAETTGAPATVTFIATPTVFLNHDHLLGVSIGGNDYGLFCPAGGHWKKEDLVFTCHAPRGKHYVSVALLPSAQSFAAYARVAFVFPTQTSVHWAYDRERSHVTTTFDVVTEHMEGGSYGFLQALYPHQYTTLEDTSSLSGQSYASARGPMRVLEANTFTTVNKFRGLLPFLPAPASMDRHEERTLLQQAAAETNHFNNQDTYNFGKALNRLAQLLPLAAMNGDTGLGAGMAGNLRTEFALWTSPGSRTVHRFTYDAAWGTLIGYPASFGSNTELNDHHFHYGYWIGSAAMLGLYDPAWLRKPENASLLRELCGDIATLTPGDARYPMLRTFDAYAGHSWASGRAPFGDGENQESSSEAVNAWAGIALYAAETKDVKLRDAALWMYTLETNAAIDYWFNDGPVSTFPAGFEHTQITNLFDGKSDTATWFGNPPEFEHGIQFLPFSGASLYLGRDPAYVRRNLAEVVRADGGALRTHTEFWPDLMEMYESFDDPKLALSQWRGTRYVFDGESKAHEFAWMSSMAAYGRVDQSVSADTAFYAVFRNSAGLATHVAFNPDGATIEVRFSDGVGMHVPGHAMVANERVIALPQ